jgi:diguanylate cyclase (GGDEF)-like protein/PAS domain S-box-containing protein
MNAVLQDEDKLAPAGGQTVRLPGSSRSVSLHEQLYRYADDLQLMIERNSELAADNDELRESSERLLESREELDAIMQSSLDIHLITDAAGSILQSNPAGRSLAPAEKLEHSNLADWVEAAHMGDFVALHSNALRGNHGPEQGVELHLHREDAQRPPLIVTARVLAVRRGENLRHLHWILRDVTYLRETEFETRIASMVFKNATEGVMITDVEGGILAVNTAFTTITGYSASEALGRRPGFLSSGHHGPEFYEAFWVSLRTTGSWQGVLFNRRRNGETYPERLTVNAVRDTDGQILSYIAVFSDLSQEIRTPDQEPYQAHHRDPLTRVANRQLLEDRLERLISLSRRSGVPFGLFRIDIDGFAAINASYGHLAGDRVLRTVADRLVATVRESDTVARFNADNFVLLAPGMAEPDDIRRFGAKLLDALHQAVMLEEQEIIITASLGCARFPDHGQDVTRLLDSALLALDQARAGGGKRCEIFDNPPQTLTPDRRAS